MRQLANNLRWVGTGFIIFAVAIALLLCVGSAALIAYHLLAELPLWVSFGVAATLLGSLFIAWWDR